MAQKQGSQEMVRRILLDQISAFVSTRVMESDEQAHEYIEKYLVLDQSNALVYASLGVVRYRDGDYPGAIQAFQTSLDLEDGMTTHEYSRSLVAIALLETMFAMNDFAGIMSQIQRYGPSTSISWIRESLDHTDFQRGLMYAARKTGRTDLLIGCYQQGINDGQFSENDLRAMKNSAPEKLARLKLLLRSRNLAASSMFRCYLAWLHQECLGQYEEAIDLWKIAFFQRPEFLKLGKVYSSTFTTDIVPDMFARFSQLLYDKALQRDGEIDEPTVALLERLSQRHEAFRNLERDSLELTDQRNVNLLLARLYWRCGRKEEARKLLNEQFQRVMDLLRDDIGWNDTYGYQLLARALLTNSQPKNAELAASLTRFFEHGYNPERNDAADDDLYEIEPTCAGWCTFSDGRQVDYNSPLYACTTCANVVFCERCYQTLRAPETAEDKIFVCNPDHEFLRSPAEGLERVENGVITMNGKMQSFAAWLDEVQKEWKTGLYFRM